jgi:hypothetical protein
VRATNEQSRAGRALSALLLCAGCQAGPTTTVMMSFDRALGFYAAPFPSDDLRRSDGTIALDNYPNPNKVDLINQGIALLNRDNRGFALSAGIFFRTSAELDPKRLPDVNATVTAHAPVFVMAVDPAAPDFLQRHPMQVDFTTDGGPFGDRNLLSLLPVQGLPLVASTRYAAVVLKHVVDLHGNSLVASPTMALLAAGKQPPALSADVYDEYRSALSALAQAGVHAGDIAGLAVFTTGAPTAQMAAARDDVLSRPLPAPNAAPMRTDVFPDYCVYSTTINMPDYQSGVPPFQTFPDGAWLFDANGKPIFQRSERANLVFTVPRAAQPAAGFPLVVFVRAGGGGDRPLVDRGTCATEEFTKPIVPGTGPAQYFARTGFAGVQVDGPLGGLRNPTNEDEEFLLFNAFAPSALRDNVRESALELMVLVHVLKTLTFSAADCMGTDGSPVHFDFDHLAIMGHSNGAWITPLVVAHEPLIRAAILSGAGGSYIANIMDKQKPEAVRIIAEAVLDYQMDQRSLTPSDPALTMVQWAAEPSDPQVYAPAIVRAPRTGERPRSVLMLQGIVDHYILPSIANTSSLSLGLDLAGPALDAANAEEAMLMQTPVSTWLPLAGRAQLTLPVSGNVDAMTTAVLVQHNGDAIEDGHEVVFQTDAPKHQYRCFLQSFLRGVPSVVVDDTADAPCP